MTIDRLSQIIQSAPELRHVAPDVRANTFEAMPEHERLSVVRNAGRAPEACGDAMPIAPARGAGRAVHLLASYPKGDHETEVKPAGHLGRKTVFLLDAIDTMRAQSARKGKAFSLTESQIGMARMYATMVADHLAGAVRCTSLEAAGGGHGGTREGFTDHRLDLSRRIDQLRRRIGVGCALAIRRVRPSKRGDGPSRANIPDRALVDLVCLEGLTISEVLARYGWSIKGETVQAATRALGDALDRMVGPRPRQDIQVVHFGVPSAGLLNSVQNKPS